MPQTCCPVCTLRQAGLLSLLILATSCSPEREPKEEASNTPKRKHPILHEVKLEVRPDGLAYAPGAATPFTGDAVELHYNRTPPRLFVRAPYLDGKKHGVKTTYSSGGKLREERTYRNGRPIHCIVYHGNGQKKIEFPLNEQDLGEGAYRRWHDNGVLECESSFDAEERLHGEEKGYDRQGKLVGHFRKENGRLIEVLLESAEMKAERIAKWGPSVPGDEVIQSSGK